MRDNGKVCTTCGHVGRAKRVTKGSLVMEIFLWLLFLAPGFIYSIWRLTTRFDGCAMCGSGHLVPANSPVGRRLIQDQHGEARKA